MPDASYKIRFLGEDRIKLLGKERWALRSVEGCCHACPLGLSLASGWCDAPGLCSCRRNAPCHPTGWVPLAAVGGRP